MRLLDWLPIGQVPEIAPKELARRLGAGEAVQVLDVRSTLEFRRGHIARAVHVPVHQLSSSLARLGLDRHLPVVAVCKTAHRSIPAVRLLRAEGYVAMQLAGGMGRWRRLGLPIVSGEMA